MPETRPRTDEIEDAILTFVRSELLPPGITLDREDDLLSDHLDSVAALRLAAHVDETFGITTGPQDFVIENFENAAVLARYIERTRGDA